MLKFLVENKLIGKQIYYKFQTNSGSVYAIADISYSLAYAFGPVIAGGIVHGVSFLALNIIICVLNLGYSECLWQDYFALSFSNKKSSFHLIFQHILHRHLDFFRPCWNIWSIFYRSNWAFDMKIYEWKWRGWIGIYAGSGRVVKSVK